MQIKIVIHFYLIDITTKRQTNSRISNNILWHLKLNCLPLNLLTVSFSWYLDINYHILFFLVSVVISLLNYSSCKHYHFLFPCQMSYLTRWHLLKELFNFFFTKSIDVFPRQGNKELQITVLITPPIVTLSPVAMTTSLKHCVSAILWSHIKIFNIQNFCLVVIYEARLYFKPKTKNNSPLLKSVRGP